MSENIPVNVFAATITPAATAAKESPAPRTPKIPATHLLAANTPLTFATAF